VKSITDVAFVVQSRLNSERIPKKMIKDFKGTTLLDLVLEKLVNTEIIPNNQIYLSVHEDELVEVGKKYPINIHKRSWESANCDNGIEVMFDWWDKLPFKYVVMISGCNPLLKKSTINNFIKTYLNSEHDGLFSVVEKKNYFWNRSGELINDWPDGQDLLNTKAVEPIYEAGHCLYGSLLSSIGDGKWCGTWKDKNSPELFTVDELETFDIDYPWQFEVAEKLYEQ
tara:strand:+ start:273 stop:950 length:678 start_codon:yes stop_codon:yes gene_type:complete